MRAKRVRLGAFTSAGFSGGLKNAPASEGGRYKGKRNPRGRGKPRPYKDKKNARGGVKPPLRGQSRSWGKCGLEARRVLGDDVEGALEGEAGAAEGAFFEEAAD